MLDFLRNIFSSITDFFSSVWSFLSGILDKLVSFFRVAGKAVVFLIELLQSIPTVYIVFGVITIGVLVIYLIIGRQAGGD